MVADGDTGPSGIRALADEVLAYRLDNSAALRLQLGLPVERLRAESDAAFEQDGRFASTALADLARLEPVDEDDRLTAGFLEFTLGSWADRARCPQLGFTVTPYTAFFLGRALQQVFAGWTGSPASYLQLVGDYRDSIAEMRLRLVRQREAGVLIPRPALPGVRVSLASSRSAADQLLRRVAPSSLGGDHPVVDEVAAAHDALLVLLDEQYEADAPTAVGWSQYDGGAERYRQLVREHTASQLSPEQLHQLGLEQVAELTERMANVRVDLGFPGSEADFQQRLASDPTLGASTPDEVERLFLRHMAALEPLLGSWFRTLPKAPYGVRRLDPELEAGLTYGYYQVPTAADPVGRYRWNGADLESKSLLNYATLVFHELAPGHHFHLAGQLENHALPELRRVTRDIGAFNEGWAEYAAGLGWEMGLYDEPLDAYGRLVHERFTAVRLVVDTGLNLLGWSLERAAHYLRTHSTESEQQIASEVLRYSTDLPGQALAYRAGFIELNRLRHASERAFGGRFDVRDFHDRVLGPGALPFSVLEGHLDRWQESS